MKNSTNIILGIVGAATAGVIVGMLIAPEKGEQLRTKLRESVVDIAKKIGELLVEGKDQFQSLKLSALNRSEVKNGEANAFDNAKSSS